MKTLCVLLCCALFCALLGGCTPHTDYLAPLRGDFEADISGEMNGVAFSALCAAEAGESGEKTVTLTFYAPETLADTVAKRAADGAITLSVGEVTVADEKKRLAPLFDLLCPTGEVTEASLTDEGYTRVTGDGFAITFLADGTPYLLENGGVKVTAISFTPK